MACLPRGFFRFQYLSLLRFYSSLSDCFGDACLLKKKGGHHCMRPVGVGRSARWRERQDSSSWLRTMDWKMSGPTLTPLRFPGIPSTLELMIGIGTGQRQKRGPCPAGPPSAFFPAVPHPQIPDHIHCREKGRDSAAPVFPGLEGNYARILAGRSCKGAGLLHHDPVAAKFDGTWWVPTGDFFRGSS